MFEKISPKKISDEIIEQFKGLVRRGELKPGDELPSERELAEAVGVSRPPLREALNALQAMGFIEIKPRRRIVVKSLAEKAWEDPMSRMLADDIQMVFDLLEMRSAMEGWAAYHAARRATSEDLERLTEIVLGDQESLKQNRDDATTDADFHIAIATATHNTLFCHLMASCYRLLWDTQRVSRERIFKTPENIQHIGAQHLKIYEAIQARDAETAGRLARDHIDFVAREMRKVLEEENTKGEGRGLDERRR